jgi:hypothetical protein
MYVINLPNPSSRTIALQLTQPLTEMSIAKSFGGGGLQRGRRVRLTTSLTSVSLLSRKCWVLGSHNPTGLHGLLQVVRFEVFSAVTMKNGVLWDVTPCGSCKNRRFRRT